MWVSPFGNLWVEAYLQLTTAYRSLSRPSSAPDAKAFTLRSCSLELLVYFLYLVLFELSEFLEHFVQDYIDSFRCEKTFFSPFALAFELRFRAFHLAVKLYFPFRLERLNNLLFLSSSVRFLLKNLFLLFDCQRSFAFAFANASSFLRKEETCRTRFSEFCGRSGWTRTIDLALIRRAL